jgi:aryl-alcohol dehydrogenase-like predicted oxidoreductase
MRQRALGRTGLPVGELALGGLFLASDAAQFTAAKAAVLHGIEMGVNYIDTAPAYGDSEQVLGQILPLADRPVLVSTKLGGRPRPFRPQDPECLRRSVRESLRLLRRDHIDILMIHEPDRPGQYDWWTDQEQVTGPVLDVLDELKREGTIGYAGLAGTTAYELASLCRTGKFDVVLTAFNYSLLWREAELEVLPAARDQGMGVVVGAPLQQGALSRRHDDEITHAAAWLSPPRRAQFLQLYAALDEAGLGVAETALRFVISNPAVSCVLTGVRSAAEAEQNIAAVARGPLHADLLARLDEIAAAVPFRPFDEPPCLPFGRPFRGPGPMV